MSDESVVEHLVELDDASRLLLRAAALIEERGLERELYENDCGGLCVMGAITRAAGSTSASKWGEFQHAAFDLLRKTTSIEPYLWIKNPAVSQAEVVAVMRSVALGS